MTDHRSVATDEPTLDAEQRYRALLDALGDAYCEIEVLFDAQARPVDYRFIDVSRHFVAQTGLVDALGKRMRELAPALEQHWFELYGKVALGGRPASIVERAEALGRWYEVRAHRIGGDGSHRVGVLFKDVTERELGRARERDSEMRAGLALAIAELGTFRLDPVSGRVTFDSRMAQQFGLPFEPATLELDQLVARIHPDDRQSVLELASSTLDPEFGGRYELDYRVLWPDGSEHWICANGQAQFVGEGEARRAVAVLGTTRDVTSSKHDEALLRESERRLGEELAAARALQHLSTRLITGEPLDALFAKVLEAACTLMNADAATLQMLDPAHGTLTLLASRGLHPESARLWHVVQPGGDCACGRAIASGERVVVPDVETWDALHGEQALLPYRLSGTRAVQSTLLVSRSGQPLGMVSTHWFQPRDLASTDFSLFDVLARQVADLVDRSRTEQALVESEERLREADVRKDEFLATLAHELRNPLATIRTAVDLIGRAPDALDADALHAMLHRQVEHMVRLIDELMEVSRISRGVIELSREPVDLAEVLAEVVEAARPAIQRAGLVASCEVRAAPLVVHGDRVRLSQVLSNLVSNAVRYTDPGGRVDVVAWREDGKARVSITDTGIGIAAEMLPGLFTMFRQINRRDVRSQGGLGIGLSLAQRLAQMHGGLIQAESTGLGHGSRFTVDFPLSAHLPASEDGGESGDVALQNGCRVLVVDDNHDAADSTAMLLGALGAEVRVAYDGKAALRALERWRPDVVLLDIGMPGMDGMEVAKRIRARPDLDGIRLVALSGWGQSEDLARARASGFDHHLVKPAATADLTDVLHTLSTRCDLDPDPTASAA